MVLRIIIASLAAAGLLTGAVSAIAPAPIKQAWPALVDPNQTYAPQWQKECPPSILRRCLYGGGQWV